MNTKTKELLEAAKIPYSIKNNNFYLGNNTDIQIPGIKELGDGDLCNIYVDGNLSLPDVEILKSGAMTNVYVLGYIILPKLAITKENSINKSIFGCVFHSNSITDIAMRTFKTTIIGSDFRPGSKWQPDRIDENKYRPYLDGACVLGHVIGNTGKRMDPNCFGAKQLKNLNLNKEHELIYWITVYKNITGAGTLQMQTAMDVMNYGEKMTLAKFMKFMKEKNFSETKIAIFKEDIIAAKKRD
ncbi:MAG: hypothetical protein FWG80_01045 [Alphaproteobacteria bacterium]|nr:hypothetical protein [Alphaproteobacteria bacterium]